MRLRLILVSLAVSSMVAVAFSVPLALLVRQVARDRAVAAAEHDASSLGPVLAVSTDAAVVEPAIERTVSGSRHRLSVLLPGSALGAEVPAEWSTIDAAAGGTARRVHVDGGVAIVQPFVLSGGRPATVVVFVPDSVLEHGVARSWLILALVAVALVAGSVAVADRLAFAVIRPTRRLADAATSLGAGDLDTRVELDGPKEIAEVARAFNQLAGRVRQLLAAERELVADLSHRLRTPLTALRLDADALGPGDAADRVRDDATRIESAVTAVIQDARSAGQRTGETVDPSEIVAERSGFWAPLADEQGRRWDVALADPCALAVDAGELRAAVDALVNNVFAHTPEGVAARMSVVRHGDAVEIAVEDDGPGLQGGALERGSSGSGSTGLGLDIARRTAERAGGSFAIAAAPSGGARVVMRFPVVSPRE